MAAFDVDRPIARFASGHPLRYALVVAVLMLAPAALLPESLRYGLLASLGALAVTLILWRRRGPMRRYCERRAYL